MKKLRGYSLICVDDKLAYDFIVARNCKEAKRLMIENCSEWINDGENPILHYYAKWDKEADITGLKLYDSVEDNELIKRNICNYLEYGICPICKNDDTSIYKLEDGTICCEECEEKIIKNGRFKANNSKKLNI